MDPVCTLDNPHFKTAAQAALAAPSIQDLIAAATAELRGLPNGPLLAAQLADTFSKCSDDPSGASYSYLSHLDHLPSPTRDRASAALHAASHAHTKLLDQIYPILAERARPHHLWPSEADPAKVHLTSNQPWKPDLFPRPPKAVAALVAHERLQLTHHHQYVRDVHAATSVIYKDPDTAAARILSAMRGAPGHLASMVALSPQSFGELAGRSSWIAGTNDDRRDALAAARGLANVINAHATSYAATALDFEAREIERQRRMNISVPTISFREEQAIQKLYDLSRSTTDDPDRDHKIAAHIASMTPDTRTRLSDIAQAVDARFGASLWKADDPFAPVRHEDRERFAVLQPALQALTESLDIADRVQQHAHEHLISQQQTQALSF